MVHFTGAARSPWRHAIRMGLEVGPEGQAADICDWWGDLNSLIKREKKRISIIFAFA